MAPAPTKASNGSREKGEIRNPDGKPVFNMEGAVVPSSWSQIATDIIAQKYFRKAGVPADKAGAWIALVPESQRILSPAGGGGETDAGRYSTAWPAPGPNGARGTSYFDHRGRCLRPSTTSLSTCWPDRWRRPTARSGSTRGSTPPTASRGPAQGHYYVDPDTGEVTKSASAYERPQPHACFILNIEDDLVNEGGIMDLLTREARLFKYGSGTGTNFSKIRGLKRVALRRGNSSGLLSFLKVADRSASAIKSGGTTRRAAKMVIPRRRPPRHRSFINWKAEEEHKVACLVTGSEPAPRQSAAWKAARTGGRDDGGVASDASGEDRFSLRRAIRPCAGRRSRRSATGIPAPVPPAVIQFAARATTGTREP